MIANGPMGTRVIVDASSGTFDGPRLRGTVSGPGGDWVTVRADGTMQLDVRILLKTDDGADIYCEYKGIGLDGATHITTAPMFQTAHENYTWLNNVVAIGSWYQRRRQGDLRGLRGQVTARSPTPSGRTWCRRGSLGSAPRRRPDAPTSLQSATNCAVT